MISYEIVHLLKNEIVFIFISCFLLILTTAFIFNNLFKSESTKKLPRSKTNALLLYCQWFVKVYRTHRDWSNGILEGITYVLNRHTSTGVCYLKLYFFNMVFLFHPDTVQPLLKDSGNIDKSWLYHLFQDWLKYSVFVKNGEDWRIRRKLLTSSFHLELLENFSHVMENISRIVVQKLKDSAKAEYVDIIPYMTKCSLDILYETAMGIHANSENRNYEQYGKALSFTLNGIVARVWQFHLWPNFIFYLTPQGRMFKKNLELLDRLTNEIIEERLKETQEKESEDPSLNKKRMAFLDLLLDCSSKDPSFTLENVNKEVQMFLFAGHETSAITLSWAIYLLGKHPEVQKKIQEEIDDIFGNDTERSITKDDLQKMKYTECVIKETQRLYPPVPFIARKLSKEITVNGYRIPKGTECGIPIYYMHKDPKIFSNPKKFQPERFLPENSATLHPYAFIPFSAGPRICIGKRFAMLEMKIIIANMIRNVSIESLNQKTSTKLKVTMHPGCPLMIKVKPRHLNGYTT